MPNAISLITLLTDFGERDAFVGSMKGVILNVNPQARLVDVSHRVRPHDVEEGAFLLRSCYHYFPEGTVHVAVVDPGVGTSRRPLLVSTARYFFLAPDNGLLSFIYENERSVEVRRIENRQYRLDSEGATFDGRDLFAPAAAWLTRGLAAGTFGRLVSDYVRLPVEEPGWRGSRFVGRIIHVDHFGNLISNLTAAHVQDVKAAAKRQTVTIGVAGTAIQDLTASYEDGSPDAARALINSSGLLEIFVKEGSAAGVLKVSRGEPIELV
jgi:S-adenosylmethionine hydrolase